MSKLSAITNESLQSPEDKPHFDAMKAQDKKRWEESHPREVAERNKLLDRMSKKLAVNQYNPIERSKASVSAFKVAQAQRNNEPRFASVVATKRAMEATAQLLRELLAIYPQDKEKWTPAEQASFAGAKLADTEARDAYLEANDAARFLGDVKEPRERTGYDGQTSWVVEYIIESLTTGTTAERTFGYRQAAEEFAQALRTRIGLPVAHIDLLQ